MMLAYVLHDHYNLEISWKPDFIVIYLDVGMQYMCRIRISYVQWVMLNKMMPVC